MKQITMIGNAHLDPVWLWQWREGYQEIKATFRSALDRLNETPDFVFTCACAGYYQWVEENAPEMFEEIRARVSEGRWVIVGGMWIQPDMNVPSGESVARQLLYSQRYFQEKFGKTADVGYNVDTFGHNGMLPQLLRRAGMHSYVWMRPSVKENPDVPLGAMRWEGVDGSCVDAYHIFNEYPRFHDVPEKIDRTFEMSDALGLPAMCFYGVGNHGGGPTIENLREIDDYIAQNPKGGDVAYGSPDGYFAEMRAEKAIPPLWKGELQHHASGCYSTHSESKRLHRQAENALGRMESLGALSQKLTGHQLKKPFVMQAWHNLMFNEFHDIMGGCSLPESMADAVVQLSEAVSVASREENAALQKISWKVDTIKGHPERVRSKESDWSLWGVKGQGTPVVVFNPHGFDAEGTVLLRRPVRQVRDDDGNPVPCQLTRATRTNGSDKWDSVFRAKVPALGYRLYWVFLEEGAAQENAVTATETVLENELLRAEFDEKTGALAHLIDKKTGRDALSGPVRAELMDISHCDTWAHMVFRFDKSAGCFGGAKATVLEQGPVRGAVKVVSRYGDSELEQVYTLNAGSDQLEVSLKIRLREKHRMLKLCFPTEGRYDVSEIPYGAIRRVSNGDEQPCQRWVAMQGEAGGLAVLNDGRYSYSAQDGELRMTVANTSIFADHYGQNDRDGSCEFMDMEELRLNCALVPFEGGWCGAVLNRRAAVLNRPLTHVVETYHEGPLGGEYRGIEIDNPCVGLGAVKRAEDGSGLVLRLNETAGRWNRAEIDIPLAGRRLSLTFHPFELKTILLPDDPARPPREILLTELGPASAMD